MDGCEDSDRNGRFDAKETTNFNPAEDQEKSCDAPTVEITSPAEGSRDDDCVVSLQGKVTSEFALTGLTALVTSGSQSSSTDMAWSGSAPNYTFAQNVPLFPGDNLVMVSAVDEGASSTAYVHLSCTATRDVHIQLSWPQVGSDVDLHFTNPQGSTCYYGNTSPDWGVPGDNSDNPYLDVDCITSCTLENIYLNKPEAGTYQIRVNYFNDRDLGPTGATVRLWVAGTLHEFGPYYLSDGQDWNVATLKLPEGTVTPGDSPSAVASWLVTAPIEIPYSSFSK
jgi:uncharacterized protein YfaP (DUF2135 family)